VSHEDAEAQLHDVEGVLRQLGIDRDNSATDKRAIMEVWNKIDRLDEAERTRLRNAAERRSSTERPVLVSAATGEGMAELGTAVEARLAAGRALIELEIDPADGAGISWLHRHTEVIHKGLDEKTGRIAMTVRADAGHAAAVRHKYTQRS
jgi:GTP-binding protein HflX